MSGGAVLTTALPLPLLHRGKVRDVYRAGHNELLLVASDRVSAFDVVMNQPVPRKGEVLTMITAWWLARLAADVDHHLLAVHPDAIARRHPVLEGTRAQWARRAMLVRRTNPLPVECVVRGYLAGSAWKEYRASGTLAGEPLPEGLEESAALPSPLYSPATKARQGHDENIAFATVVERLGEPLAKRLRERSLDVYALGRDACAERGVLLADTKFEFGLDADERLLLIDEVMTPDSSRFWPRETYVPGRAQPSLDKQPVRDWLDGLPGWDHAPPPPDLPAEVLDAATARYLEVFRRLTGSDLDDWSPPDEAGALT